MRSNTGWAKLPTSKTCCPIDHARKPVIWLQRLSQDREATERCIREANRTKLTRQDPDAEVYRRAMTLTKRTVRMSMFATAEMVANSGHFTKTRAPRANRAGAGRRKPLIDFSQGS